MRFLLLLAGLAAVVQVAAQTTISKKEAKVRAYLANGKAYKAINQCNAMLGRDPQPVFYALRADGRNRIGEHAQAEQDARLGLKALPNNHGALLQLAIAEQGLGRNDSAIVRYQQLLSMSPDPDIRYRLAQTYQAKKDFTNALSQLDQIIGTAAPDGSGTAKIHRTKGECLSAMGDTAAGRQAFERALALSPDDPVTFNSRGWFLYAQYGDHARAIADYDRAIKINPNYSYAFNNRGWSRYKSGNKDRALRDIGLAKKKKVFNPYIYRNLGIIALESRDTVAACTQFRRALDYNFTAMYGDEVERLVLANCRNENKGEAPVQAPNAPIDRPRKAPATRTNAP